MQTSNDNVFCGYIVSLILMMFAASLRVDTDDCYMLSRSWTPRLDGAALLVNAMLSKLHFASALVSRLIWCYIIGPVAGEAVKRS